MIAKYNLHLVLSRHFQLPIELRFIIVETYFPFLPNEKFPLTESELLKFANSTNHLHERTNYFHFLPIYQSVSQQYCGKWTYALCLKKKGTLIEALVYRGNHISMDESYILFMPQEVIFWNEKCVSFYLDAETITKVNVREKQQKITNLYRKYVMSAMNGIGYFKNVNG